MIDRKPTHRTVRVFLGVLAMVSLLVPALALGQSGDWDQPQPLTVPTSTVATAATDHSWIYYSVNATAGQTILVTVATPGTDGAALMGTFEDAYTVEAAHSAPSTVSLTFMPSKTRSYLLAVSSGTPGTCSISATPTAAQPFQLSRVTASNTLSRAKTYPLSAQLHPAYNGLTCPLRFMIERKSGKKWKAYTSVAGRFSSRFLSGDTAKVSSKFKLAKSGWYRVRARLVDAAHPRGVFSAWKTVRVR